MAISSIIMLCVIEILVIGTASSVHSNDMLQGMESGTAALDFITQDVESCLKISLPFTSEYLQALPNSQISSTSPSMFLAVTSFDPVDSFSTAPDYSTAGSDRYQPRAVIYGIAYQDPLNSTGTSKVFSLYRTSVKADASFGKMLTSSDLFTDFGNLSATDFDSGVNPFSSTYTPSPNDVIASNVVDLEVAVYLSSVSSIPPYVYSSPALANVPTGSTYQKVQLANSGTIVNGALVTGKSAGSGLVYGQPAFLEISLTVINSSATALYGDGSGTGNLSPANLKAKYGHILTRRIYLGQSR